VILGIVVSVAKLLSQTVLTFLAETGFQHGDMVFEKLVEYYVSIFGCAVMAVYSGKLASSIASGNASFSGGDAIRGGMAAAAAVGVGAAAFKPASAAGIEVASAAGKGVNALKSAFGGGAPSAPSGPAAGAMAGFGGPPMSKPPSLENRLASTGGASSTASGSQGAGSGLDGASANGADKQSAASQKSPAGKGETAGVEGTTTPEEKRHQQMMESLRRQMQPSAAEQIGRAAELAGQDQQQVGVQINTRGE
jgi:type IV secretion system protein TrbL